MPCKKYTDINFTAPTLEVITQANEILDEYWRKYSLDLTLRQLYYQFVSRDLIPNKQKQYKRLGEIISKARLAGLIDWLSISDRTRNLASLSHWANPGSIVEACVRSYRLDKWGDQPYYIEVWVEKEALSNVVASACNALDVPYFACKGYVSQSEMWAAAQRIEYAAHRRHAIILHLGDHDPSGIDMSRDISERLELFVPDTVNVNRIALNMSQIEELKPPPNPAKTTDSRYAAYIKKYGHESWELDALDPGYIQRLINTNVSKYINPKYWQATVDLETEHRDTLKRFADNWQDHQ